MDLTEYRRSIRIPEPTMRTPIYLSIEYEHIEDDPEGDYLEVPQTMYSDYSGSTVDRANCNTFLKRFGALEGVYEVYGGYCTRGVLIKYELYNTNAKIKELIDGLEKYPVFDNDELILVEDEIEKEAWESWIKGDLIRALEKRGKIYPGEESALLNKFYETCDEISEYVIFENAVSCWIDVEKIAEVW